MQLPDAELLRRLILRDGVLPPRTNAHTAGGACRYAELYANGRCPWCEAEQRRAQREGISIPRITQGGP